MTALLVEQNVQQALALAHYAYMIRTGQVVAEGAGKEPLESDIVRKAFLGL